MLPLRCLSNTVRMNRVRKLFKNIKYSSLSIPNDGRFRRTTWDPVLIIFQIVALQSIYYLSLALLLNAICYLSGTSRSINYIFNFEEIRLSDSFGKLLVTVYIVNALIGSIPIWFIVERSKLCLDFASTTYFNHTIISWYYGGGFPSSVSWWVLIVTCACITCVCAEFLCMRTELKTIPINASRRMDL